MSLTCDHAWNDVLTETSVYGKTFITEECAYCHDIRYRSTSFIRRDPAAEAFIREAVAMEELAAQDAEWDALPPQPEPSPDHVCTFTTIVYAPGVNEGASRIVGWKCAYCGVWETDR